MKHTPDTLDTHDEPLIPQPLGAERCAAISEQVRIGLPRIFGDNLVFGFVCGGIAKGYADNFHDIDTFSCVRSLPDPQTEDAYYRWYFELHREFGLPPDFDYPGEVVTLERLSRVLKILKTLKLTLSIDSVDTKKAIIWTDMITGGIAGRTGQEQDLLDAIIAEYGIYPAQWKREILDLIPPEERSQWENVVHTLIMERYMRYPKHDGKKLEGRYGHIFK